HFFEIKKMDPNISRIPESIVPPTTAQPQVTKDQGPELKKEPAQIKQEALQVAGTEHKDIQSLSKSLISTFISHDPNIQKQIDTFTQEHPEKIATIKENTWNDLKAQHGSNMTQSSDRDGISLEEFRGRANQLIANLTADIGKQLGLSSITWSACGTEGYDSDVDSNLIGKDVTTQGAIQEAALYKTIRDAVHTHIFGGTSGVQLDTESYVPHAAKLNFSSKLTSKDAQTTFHTSEMANVVLQRYASLGKHPAVYQASKQIDLDSIQNPDHREAMEILYSQVESAMTKIDNLVNRKMLEQHGITAFKQMNNAEVKIAAKQIIKNDPHAYKNAREAAFVPLRIELGSMCQNISEQIASKEGQLEKVMQHPQSAGTSIETLNKEIEELNAKQQKIFTLINFLQDEGTNTEAEGKATLLQSGGQVHAGKLKKAKDQKFDQELAKQKGLKAHLISKGSGQVLETFYTGDLRTELAPSSFETPTGATLTVAAYEEGALFRHIIDDGLPKNDPTSTGDKAQKNARETAISAGKYCQRICRNNLRALQVFQLDLEAKGLPSPRRLQSLTPRAKKAEFKSTQLERCKRKFTLNKVATQKMLVDAIASGQEKKGQHVDRIMLNALVGRALDDFEYGGRFDGQVFTKEEHMNILMKFLEKKGYVEGTEGPKGSRIPADKHIRYILQARVGYDRTDEKYSSLNSIHERADQITLSSLGLTSPGSVRSFADSVLNLSADIRNMAMENGLLPTASINDANNYDLSGIINQAQANLTRAPK
ncbi:MAG: hypothetical protein K940chlam2_01722, partial [Chlamydiae bacterium]|nr:hypothetical protein [Chlamydiota bacterium]